MDLLLSGPFLHQAVQVGRPQLQQRLVGGYIPLLVHRVAVSQGGSRLLGIF